MKGHDYWWLTIQVNANVTEAGTEQSEYAKGEISVTRQMLALEITSESDNFRTGLPYEAEVKIINAQELLQNKTIQICYDAITSRERWVSQPKFCSNFSVPSEGRLRFTIPPFGENVTQVYIQVEFAFAFTNT